jgi:hypothetical protein
MAEAVPAPLDAIKLSEMPEVGVVEAPTTLIETEMLNDDVLIDVAPDRPCGTIRVKLVYAGRSVPIPADDPWTE